MTAALQDMLAVEDVWCWSRSQQLSQDFVAWAERVLEHRWEYVLIAAILSSACPQKL